jgi:hypothetical protein
MCSMALVDAWLMRHPMMEVMLIMRNERQVIVSSIEKPLQYI